MRTVTDRPSVLAVELRVPQPKPVSLDPHRSALVVIDMENDFAKPEGVVYGSPRRGAVIGPIRALLDRARGAGMPVIYARSVRDIDAPEFTVFGKRRFIVRDTWGSQIVDELAPLPGEPVVEKNSHDCFNGTVMERLLAERGIRPVEWTIVVVGLGLVNCVGCAVSGFSVRNYWVVVPMDCTAATTFEEEVVQYQRFMHSGYNYNVSLTESTLIEIAEPLPTGAASSSYRSSSALRRSSKGCIVHADYLG